MKGTVIFSSKIPVPFSLETRLRSKLVLAVRMRGILLTTIAIMKVWPYPRGCRAHPGKDKKI